MSRRTPQRRGAEAQGSAQSRSRSRRRERDALMPPPRHQLLPASHAAAAIDTAYGNYPRSISRLHDDELTCVLPFLPLPDLLMLVRCSRRFRGVVGKERSRGLHIAPAIRSIPTLVRTPLSHHIGSVRLEKRDAADSHIKRSALLQLRMLRQLTKIDLRVHSEGAAAVLLRGTSAVTTAEKLQAALPTSLHSFSFSTYPSAKRRTPSAKFAMLGAAFFTAATNMRQLNELGIIHAGSWDGMQLDGLATLPFLRKLTLIGRLSGILLSVLKTMSQLRELRFGYIDRNQLVALFTPPHSLQLEALCMEAGLGEAAMRALLSMPTLTICNHWRWRLMPGHCCHACRISATCDSFLIKV
jgi:hypothetical protein